MEQRSGPQSLVSPTQVTVTPVPASTAGAAPRPGAGLVIRRTLRLLLRRFLYLLTLLLRPLRRHALLAVVTLGLLGVIGWETSMLWAPPATSTTPDTRVSMIAPSSAVENYIKGRQNFNAELMWAAFSPDVQARRIQSGQSKDNLQAQADQERTMGIRYLNYEYVGGVNLDDGGKMYFYSAQFQVAGQKAKLPATFLTDADGKVKAIYAIEPMQLMGNSN